MSGILYGEVSIPLTDDGFYDLTNLKDRLELKSPSMNDNDFAYWERYNYNKSSTGTGYFQPKNSLFKKVGISFDFLNKNTCLFAYHIDSSSTETYSVGFSEANYDNATSILRIGKNYSNTTGTYRSGNSDPKVIYAYNEGTGDFVFSFMNMQGYNEWDGEGSNRWLHGTVIFMNYAEGPILITPDEKVYSVTDDGELIDSGYKAIFYELGNNFNSTLTKQLSMIDFPIINTQTGDISCLPRLRIGLCSNDDYCAYKIEEKENGDVYGVVPGQVPGRCSIALKEVIYYDVD